MSSKTIKAFEKHTGRKSPRAQGVTFRLPAKPGLGPSLRADELERELAEHPEADGKNVRREIRDLRTQAQRLAADPTGSNQHIRNLPTLPPPPASVEVACLLARAQELEDTARMMLARAAELREVAATPRPGPIDECPAHGHVCAPSCERRSR